jgi:DNA-binding NarL/FixJ family response regulator
MASYHVLIVANQKKDRQEFRAGIESLGEGMRVFDASSGEEALLMHTRQPLDLLVSEFHLAGISGQELMLKVKLRYPEAKTILIAGGQDTATIQDQAIAAGAQAFFSKPVDMPVFLKAVQDNLTLPSATSSTEASLAEALPSKPVVVVSETPSAPTLASSLERLRRELDAFAVLLVVESGKVINQAGDLPDLPGKAALEPALRALIEASTGLSNSIGKGPPQDLVFISGSHFDVYMAHAGQAQTLVALTHPEAGIQRLEKTLHILLAAANALAQDLINIRLANLDSAPRVKRRTDELATGRLGGLLSQAPESQNWAQEVDSFWEAAAEQAYHEGLPRTGSLSYEQARKLGLAPQEPDQ